MRDCVNCDKAETALEVERRRHERVVEIARSMVVQGGIAGWREDLKTALAALDAGEPEHLIDGGVFDAAAADPERAELMAAADRYHAGSVEGEPDQLAIVTMERDWVLAAWAAACGVSYEQAKADMLAWSAKWRPSAVEGGGDGRPDLGEIYSEAVSQAKLDRVDAATQHLAGLGAVAVAERNAARDEWSGSEAIYCGDCVGPARPMCDFHGHGLVTFGELIDCWANPSTRAVPVDREARIEKVAQAIAKHDGNEGEPLPDEGGPALSYEQGWELLAETRDALEWMEPRSNWRKVRDRLEGACDALEAWLPAGTEPEDASERPSLDLDARPSGLPDEPSESVADLIVELEAMAKTADKMGHSGDLWQRAADALKARVDALPEREDGEPTHICLACGELGRTPDDSHGRADCEAGGMVPLSRVIELVGELGTMRVDRDQAVYDRDQFAENTSDRMESLEAEVERLEKREAELLVNYERLRAAVPLSTDVLRNPSDELLDAIEKRLGEDSDRDTRLHADDFRDLVLAATAEHLESQSPPSPAGDDGRTLANEHMAVRLDVVDRLWWRALPDGEWVHLGDLIAAATPTRRDSDADR